MSEERKVFEGFKFRGVKFIAIRRDDGVGVLDEHGNFYGTYYTIATFQDYYIKAQEKGESLVLGKKNIVLS